MTKNEWKVPYDSKGNLMHYPSYNIKGWRPATNFVARLTCNRMESGRSAKYVIWEGADGQTYPMFIRDLIDALAVIEKGGVLDCEFAYSKRGHNYGIRVFGLQAQDKE